MRYPYKCTRNNNGGENYIDDVQFELLTVWLNNPQISKQYVLS